MSASPTRPKAEFHLRRRKWADRLMTAAVSGAGVVSLAVLLGIFGLLGKHSVSALTGGLEMEPLTPAERIALGPDLVRALEARPASPPNLVTDILLEPSWQPDAPGRPRYGVAAMIASTFWTTSGAMLWSVPMGIAAAGWLAFGATGRTRSVVKFAVEMLAAVPSVVIGFLGLQLVGPVIGDLFGPPGGLNALNGAILLGVMALPTIVSLSEDALSAVPRSLTLGALALGANRWQTLTGVIAPAARSGLFAAAMLGLGRAMGETMTVLMATGNVTAFPHGFLDPVRTLTATIAIELGEVPKGTTHYHMLFGVGLLLFSITLIINVIADAVVKRSHRL